MPVVKTETVSFRIHSEVKATQQDASSHGSTR